MSREYTLTDIKNRIEEMKADVNEFRNTINRGDLPLENISVLEERISKCIVELETLSLVYKKKVSDRINLATKEELSSFFDVYISEVEKENNAHLAYYVKEKDLISCDLMKLFNVKKDNFDIETVDSVANYTEGFLSSEMFKSIKLLNQDFTDGVTKFAKIALLNETNPRLYNQYIEILQKSPDKNSNYCALWIKEAAEVFSSLGYTAENVTKLLEEDKSFANSTVEFVRPENIKQLFDNIEGRLKQKGYAYTVVNSTDNKEYSFQLSNVISGNLLKKNTIDNFLSKHLFTNYIINSVSNNEKFGNITFVNADNKNVKLSDLSSEHFYSIDFITSSLNDINEKYKSQKSKYDEVKDKYDAEHKQHNSLTEYLKTKKDDLDFIKEIFVSYEAKHYNDVSFEVDTKAAVDFHKKFNPEEYDKFLNNIRAIEDLTKSIDLKSKQFQEVVAATENFESAINNYDNSQYNLSSIERNYAELLSEIRELNNKREILEKQDTNKKILFVTTRDKKAESEKESNISSINDAISIKKQEVQSLEVKSSGLRSTNNELESSVIYSIPKLKKMVDLKKVFYDNAEKEESIMEIMKNKLQIINECNNTTSRISSDISNSESMLNQCRNEVISYLNKYKDTLHLLGIDGLTEQEVINLTNYYNRNRFTNTEATNLEMNESLLSNIEKYDSINFGSIEEAIDNTSVADMYTGLKSGR